ncbi:MAG: LysM peptidoglycan-binding domain-containing protein [Tissierellia bacterium]|nr:LysM peptidoglycan-binding domain-containing protein [Tissierellia bacterium]
MKQYHQNHSGARPRPSKKRSQKFRLLFLLLLLSTAIITGGVLKPFGARAEFKERYEYTVMSGDTLWSIAQNIRTEDQDIRDTVALIVEENGLEGKTLNPGDKLILYRSIHLEE